MREINADWDEDGGHRRAHSRALEGTTISGLSEDDQEMLYNERFFKELAKIQRRAKKNSDNEPKQKLNAIKKKFPLLRISGIQFKNDLIKEAKMKYLYKDEVARVHGGELVCSESAVAYFEDEGARCMKIFVTLRGVEKDFEELVTAVEALR